MSASTLSFELLRTKRPIVAADRGGGSGFADRGGGSGFKLFFVTGAGAGAGAGAVAGAVAGAIAVPPGRISLQSKHCGRFCFYSLVSSLKLVELIDDTEDGVHSQLRNEQ